MPKITEIEILEHLSVSAKFSMTTMIAPLLLIISQLKTLLQIESIAIQLLVSISVFSFVVSAIIETLFFIAIRHLILEIKVSDLKKPSAYHDYIELVNSNNDMSPEFLLKVSKKIQTPILVFAITGWSSAIAIIFFAVWM